MPTPHNNAQKGQIAKTVLMPGDPLRAKFIADTFLQDAVLVNEVRGMLAYTGTYNGKPVTVMGSGMGMPSIGIYSYELYKFYDVENIIRIGTCGSFNENIKLLDVILSSGAYCKSYFDELLDGVDLNFIQSSQELNRKIMNKAKERNLDLKYGKTITSDVFDLYCDDEEKFRDSFPDMNFLSVEMEAFGLFYIANKLGRNASCLMTVVDSLFDKRSLTSEEREKSLNDMIEMALESII